MQIHQNVLVVGLILTKLPKFSPQRYYIVLFSITGTLGCFLSSNFVLTFLPPAPPIKFSIPCVPPHPEEIFSLEPCLAPKQEWSEKRSAAVNLELNVSFQLCNDVNRVLI